ncbi:ABC transporter ATP-binding protein [Ilumatobacter coccineus]|uniref:Putative amino acid ABC transporter ATP-binding protein n=1 Tax=Ilumatobacter coccineus (strain NBRC 103263 / KCTC 29153 / YM16-304) TaxID=1313172 RepID=A0A6C7E104_ILUCY|nr:ABC transporter ATP-binding protein [Ilumatobacter coccineus]BAN00927.1 putative amino acid ABC transporter ATP-binding protein [Ilumatobacter coccineus YM16-304]
MLSIKNLEVVYDDAIVALRGVSLDVPAGKVVALLGANGAGKTTVLRAVGGLLDDHDAKVTKGEIELDGVSLVGARAASIVRRGVGQVLEGRRMFIELTVEESLLVGAFTRSGRDAVRRNLDRVYSLFPQLVDRRNVHTGYLSGGEQQMVAIGRALMSEPSLLVLDEPSLGLAPRYVERVRDVVAEINAEGTSVLLVEQNARMALSVADHGYVLEDGRVVLDKAAEDLRSDSEIREFYLGVGDSGTRRNFAAVKHYRRRKRWLS